MIPLISNLFNLPVKRKEVLERAKRHKDAEGLCRAIGRALSDYDLMYITPAHIFPLFSFLKARPFGAKDGDIGRYWWPRNVWSTGRKDFLDWLIEQYKDDETDLRKLQDDGNN